jgi:AcrR family transcriptional regulator
MGEIADKVQMANGNLYYYFPSKQDLLFFCQDESLGRLIDEASTNPSWMPTSSSEP